MVKVSGLILNLGIAGRLVQAQFGSLGLETLDLLDYSGLQSSATGKLKSDSGVEYAIADLKPYVGMFAEDSFIVSDDMLTATNRRTGEVVEVSTFRASYGDGTMFQASIDEMGKMTYAEIRERSQSVDTFFISSELKSAAIVDGEGNSGGDIMLAFNSSSIDKVKLHRDVDLGDAPAIFGHDRNLRNDFSMSQYQETQRRTQDGSCSSLRVIKVAVAYDAELCGFYGGRAKTVSLFRKRF